MNVQEFFAGFKSDSFDINNPDFNNMGSWPPVVRLTTLLLVSALIVGGIFWFMVRSSNDALTRTVAKEPGLKEQYRSKSFQVANLDAFKAQLAQMEEDFGELLSQLPNDTDMPELLDDISTTGTQSGLEIDKITPANDVVREFYIETPISIEVRGSYHEMGNFVSSLASIERIVTLHDFNISLAGGSSANDEAEAPLKMLISARTYRYKGESQ